MIEKIKINVDYNTFSEIIKDATSFYQVKGKEEKTNLNFFLNNVIFGIHQFLKAKNETIVKGIRRSYPTMKINTDEITSLVQHVDDIQNDFVFDYIRDFYFMVYPGKQFQDFYTKLEVDDIKNRFSLSKYLFICLTKYLSNSRSTRQLIFKYKDFTTVMNAINSHNKIYVFDGKKERKISPVAIDRDSYGFNSYLKGYDEEEKQIFVKEFCDLSNIFELNEKTKITKQIYSSLEKITEKELYYFNLKTIEITAYFTSKANKISRTLLTDTPRIIKKKGNTIVFNDEEETILNYLKAFGDTINIKERRIVKKLRDFYQSSYLLFDTVYNNTNESEKI